MLSATRLIQPNIPPVIIRYPAVDPLLANGWIKEGLGQYRSNGEIKEKEGFNLYVRKRNLTTFIDDYSKKSSTDDPRKALEQRASETGSSLPMGNPESRLTPATGKVVTLNETTSEPLKQLPALSSFSDYPSLMAARKNEPSLLIGYDSEWENTAVERDMLSWQFALVNGTDLLEFVFLKTGDAILAFADALGCILDHLDQYVPVDVRTIRKYRYCSEWNDDKPVEVTTSDVNEARSKAVFVYRKELGFTLEHIQEMPDRFLKRSERNWAWFHTFLDFSSVESIRICIVCHAGKVDLSALAYGSKSLLPRLTEVQGGLVSLQPIRYAPRSLKRANNTYEFERQNAERLAAADRDRADRDARARELDRYYREIADAFSRTDTNQHPVADHPGVNGRKGQDADVLPGKGGKAGFSDRREGGSDTAALVREVRDELNNIRSANRAAEQSEAHSIADDKQRRLAEKSRTHVKKRTDRSR